MPWVEVFAAFVVCHLVGDYLLQTDWQALHKRGGLGADPWRAVRSCRISRTTRSHSCRRCLAGGRYRRLGDRHGALIAVPHWIQDDGRLLAAYIRRVKHTDPRANLSVAAAADQSFHFVALFLTALLVGQ